MNKARLTLSLLPLVFFLSGERAASAQSTVIKTRL